jgi:23S rRNA (adenine2503-C2)-methyltransferase
MTEGTRESLLGTLPAELDALLAGWGLSKFRGKQIREWVFEKLVIDPANMSNLSQIDRDRIAAGFSISDGQILREQHSSDGTIKLLIGWADGAVAETVMIPDGVRRTACISSQVGCPVGCVFCASGIGGVKGNLTAARIVEQVLAINRVMKPRGERINHIVFMGMGEPLANYANVIRAIRILNHAECFNIGARKITVSTVGVPAKMRQLADEDLSLNLAISLHAPNESLRRQLIPWAEHFDLAEILSAGRYYFERTGRELTLEYVLLGGVNDSVPQARELSHVCKTIRANVNLIRYNPVAGLEYKRPTAEASMAFLNELRERGVNAHLRKSRGSDIDAACGQLRRRQETPLAPPSDGSPVSLPVIGASAPDSPVVALIPDGPPCP